MIRAFAIERHNVPANRWEIVDYARTIDEAFDKAEALQGADRDYDETAILDAFGVSVWESTGFRQAEGLRLPLLSDCDRYNENITEEAPEAAPDGSV